MTRLGEGSLTRIIQTKRSFHLPVGQFRLEGVHFSEEQAKVFADIIESSRQQQVYREHVEMVVNAAKYELVKWIVGGVIINGVVAIILKHLV